MDDLADHRYLAYFLGSMGENAELLRSTLATVVDDHVHWRRNYFPDDRGVLQPGDQQALRRERDVLDEQLVGVLAELRRSFPFHSPRYIAHMQSDLSVPSLLGAVAGMLYNANNVTSESGAVTLEHEIEAASRLLTMVGFTPPPTPPSGQYTSRELDDYRAKLDTEYGWCHLTSGGTSANIEALWVARNVRYLSLAVHAVCRAKKLPLSVNVGAGSTALPLADLSPKQVLMLPPASATGLLGAYLDQATAAVEAGLKGDARQQAEDEARRDAWRALDAVPDSFRRNPAACMSAHPPVVLVSGAAHYSIKKAVDVLGLGTDSIVQVDTDARHRMDLGDLWEKLVELAPEANPRFPLAVIGIVGTTEEGAIDPLDGIVESRRRLEAEHGGSFWIHADGAWGGYFACLLRQSARIEAWLKARAAATAMGATPPVGARRHELPRSWVGRFGTEVTRNTQVPEGVGNLVDGIDEAIASGRWDQVSGLLDDLLRALGKEPPAVSVEDRRRQVCEHLKEQVPVRVTSPHSPRDFRTTLDLDPDEAVLRALEALGEVDSITIDPHKMGYQPYPCGAIAFRNDRVRDFVRQRAPYITALGGGRAVQQPLRRLESGNDTAPTIESPAVYTLEGSRPSFPATALHLSTKVLALDQDGHGAIMRASWRSARELFEWIQVWSEIVEDLRAPNDPARGFEFVPLAVDERGEPAPPDTNVVIFGVKPVASNRLGKYNAVTRAVYQSFTIQAERAERRYSYAQPFFLSSTPFSLPDYPIDSIAPIAARAGITDFRDAYTQPGGEMLVLRATVMNPYLHPLRERGRAALFLELMRRLDQAAREAVASLALG